MAGFGYLLRPHFMGSAEGLLLSRSGDEVDMSCSVRISRPRLSVAILFAIIVALTAGPQPLVAAEGYWKYDGHGFRPTPEYYASRQALPGHVYELKLSGGVQPGPGDGKGSIDQFFKTDDADRVQFLATSTLTFGANATLATLTAGQKVLFDVSVVVGGNDKARAIGATGHGMIAIDNRDYCVEVGTKFGQSASARGEATIPSGSPGAIMMIHVTSHLSQLGAMSSTLDIGYVWVAGTPPPASTISTAPTRVPAVPAPAASVPSPGPGGAPGARPDAPRATPESSASVARGKPASQSSQAYAAPAGRAVDGNSDGDYNRGSVTHTDSEREAWWQVDLGVSHRIDRVAVWNRTDCCAERLSKFYVLVSDAPFSASSLQAVLSQPGVSHYYVDGVAARPTEIRIARTGRYVRVQLTGTNFLSLAEVDVVGAPGGGTPQPVVPKSAGIDVGLRGFGGTWDTNWGTMILAQDGARVTGTYTQKDGRIDATLSSDGRSISGTWGQAPTYTPPSHSGRMQITLSSDQNRLTGRWWYGQNGDSGEWTGTRRDSAPGSVPPASSPATTRPAAPSPSSTTGTADVASAFAATREQFDRDFKGRAIRVSALFQQVQLTGNNPIVFVRVGDRKIVCAQAESDTPEPLARIGLSAPVWISGRMLRVEDNVLWLEPGCIVGTATP
jgi:hypothetical protein